MIENGKYKAEICSTPLSSLAAKWGGNGRNIYTTYAIANGLYYTVRDVFYPVRNNTKPL